MLRHIPVVIALLLAPKAFAEALYPPIESIKVDWDDPKTKREQYPVWYSYTAYKPHPLSRHGFLYFEGKKLYQVSFSPRYDYPNHKHITLSGILGEELGHTFIYDDYIRNCVTKLERNGEELLRIQTCNGYTYPAFRLYPYSGE